jgi:hypothetical protein
MPPFFHATGRENWTGSFRGYPSLPCKSFALNPLSVEAINDGAGHSLSLLSNVKGTSLD